MIDDISKVKILNSLLLDNDEIAAVNPTGRVRTWFHGQARLSYHDTFVGALKSGARGFLFVTNRHLPPQACSEDSSSFDPGTWSLASVATAAQKQPRSRRSSWLT